MLRQLRPFIGRKAEALLMAAAMGAGVEAGFVPVDIPQAEADALIAFYNATDGDSWTNNTNWLVDTTVNNWFGITVAGGHVTNINFAGNNVAGDAGSTLTPLAASLTYVRLPGNDLTVLDVSELTLLTYLNLESNTNLVVLDVSALTSLTYIRCNNTSIEVLDVSALTLLQTLWCYANSIEVLDISALTSLTELRCGYNSITTVDLSNLANGVSYVSVDQNGMAQAAVNSMISDIWTRRADWTDATPELNVGGDTNATPTGVYQDGYPTPLAALEEVHDLINDDDTAGIQTWALIRWNGGTAP